MVPTSLAARSPASRQLSGTLGRARLLATASVLALSLAAGTAMLAPPAAADCGPLASVVECSGTLPNGVVFSPDAFDLTINVLAGTTITNANGNGIRVPGDPVTRPASGAIRVNLYGPNTSVSSGGDGIDLFLTGAGSAAVYVGAGVTIAAQDGANSGGISIFTPDGPITVNSAGRIEAVAEGMNVSAQGRGNITLSHTGAIVAGSTGILAFSSQGALDITTAATSKIYATTNDGIFASSGSGTITIKNAGEIGSLAAATGRHGIYAKSDLGTIEITNTVPIHATLDAIRAVTVGAAGNADAGAITISNASTLRAGLDGIYARSDFGSISVTNEATGAIGTADRPVTLGIRSTTTSGSGNVTIRNAGAIAATVDGIIALNNSGSITITNAGKLYAGQFGIEAISRGGGAIDITTEANSIINAGITGILTNTSGATTIVHAGSIYGPNGITAASGGGAIDITTTATSVIDASNFGVVVSTSGNITVGNAGQITADGLDGRGIQAKSTQGTISITAAATSEIIAGRFGIYAFSDSGNITVGNSGTIRATATGIDTFTNLGTTTIANAGLIEVQGLYGLGISARGSSGPTTIYNAGEIKAATGTGIFASSDQGTITIATTANSVISGSDAIFASSTSGNITVGNAGSITAGRYGILADTGGNITIGNSGTIRATATGIDTFTNLGTTTIANAGAINAGQVGIGAGSGTGSITVGNTGTITARGVGIFADTGGNIAIGNAGAITASDIGIAAESDGAVDITTGSGSLTSGGDVGIQSSSLAGTTIRNFGRITAGAADDRLAINAKGASTVLYNAGIIEGRIRLTDNLDTVTNRGLFKTAGTNEFNGGGDVFLNQGGTVSLLGDATSAQFSGLARFENAGVVSMSNGRVGDRIVISGAAPGGASFAVVNGGRLAVDASLNGQNGSADVLVVDGAIVGTGTNTIVVNNTSSGPASFNPNARVVVVDFDPNKALDGVNSPANAFTVAPGSGDGGFFSFAAVLDAANEDWVLVNRPDASILELPSIVSAAQSLWHTSTGAWLERTADLRGPRGGGECTGSIKDDDPVVCPGGRLGAWAKAFGKRLERSQDPQQVTVLEKQSTFDISYDQNSYGLVGGFDWAVGDGSPRNGGGWVLGVMAGSTTSHVAFANSRTRVDLEGALLGGYATYLNGGLFLSAMAAANVGQVDYNGGLPEALQGTGSAAFRSIGATLDTGYRMPFAPGFFLEPGATLSYVHTDIDDLRVFGHTVNFADGESLRGRLGVRVGTTLVSNGTRFEPFLGASAWYEFLGDNTASLVSNGVLFSAADNTGGLIREVSAGVNVFSLGSTGISGFAKGNFQWGENDYHSVGGEVGVRVQW